MVCSRVNEFIKLKYYLIYRTKGKVLSGRFVWVGLAILSGPGCFPDLSFGGYIGGNKPCWLEPVGVGKDISCALGISAMCFFCEGLPKPWKPGNG